MRTKKIDPYQVTGVDGRMVLQFGPRYRHPLDDTTVMEVFHRTLDGGVSFLLERDQITSLAEWFRSESPEIGFSDARKQTTVRRYPSGHGVITCSWHSASGGSRSIALSSEDMRAVQGWLTKVDRQGWEGWKSGRQGMIV